MAHYIPRSAERLRSGNCELFAMSGGRNPYKEAKLCGIQDGAWADLLIVDDDPTTDINLLRDYKRNVVVIIKDGRIYKKTPPASVQRPAAGFPLIVQQFRAWRGGRIVAN